MKPLCLIPVMFLALAAALPAAAQTVTLTVKGVQGDKGNILASLCGEPTAKFPGPCLTHVAMGKAEAGEITLAFYRVTNGEYALEVFHDADGSMSLDFPAEGTAFGNNAAWPVDFRKAAITVQGDTSITVTMVYNPLAAAAAPKE